MNYKIDNKKLSLFEMLKAIIKPKGKLCMLSRGDSFISSDIRYITLWPSLSEVKFMKDNTKENLEKFIMKIQGKLHNQIDLMDEIKEVSFLLTKAFIDKGIYDYIVNTEDLGEKIKTDIIELEEIINKYIEELEERIGKISKCSKKLNKEVLNTDIEEELNGWIQRLKNNEHKINIVFQNEVDILKNNILMTGDIDIWRLKWIIKNDLNINIPLHIYFNVIKAPHHGTQTHFIKNLPTSKNIIISNGKIKKRKRGTVSLSYRDYRKKGALIRCTNTVKERCDFLNAGYKCNGICNKDYTRKEILIY